MWVLWAQWESNPKPLGQRAVSQRSAVGDYARWPFKLLPPTGKDRRKKCGSDSAYNNAKLTANACISTCRYYVVLDARRGRKKRAGHISKPGVFTVDDGFLSAAGQRALWRRHRAGRSVATDAFLPAAGHNYVVFIDEKNAIQSCRTSHRCSSDFGSNNTPTLLPSIWRINVRSRQNTRWRMLSPSEEHIGGDVQTWKSAGSVRNTNEKYWHFK